VTGAQKLGLVDPGDWAPPAPIVHEAFAENVLTDPLHDEPLDLRFAR
jgi:hypothetical protein